MYRIVVSNVGPGVFSNERSVTLDVNGQSYTLILPAQYVLDDNTIEVELVGSRANDQVLVDLPRETFTTGNRLMVPRHQLVCVA